MENAFLYALWMAIKINRLPAPLPNFASSLSEEIYKIPMRRIFTFNCIRIKSLMKSINSYVLVVIIALF